MFRLRTGHDWTIEPQGDTEVCAREAISYTQFGRTLMCSPVREKCRGVVLPDAAIGSAVLGRRGPCAAFVLCPDSMQALAFGAVEPTFE